MWRNYWMAISQNGTIWVSQCKAVNRQCAATTAYSFATLCSRSKNLRKIWKNLELKLGQMTDWSQNSLEQPRDNWVERFEDFQPKLTLGSYLLAGPTRCKCTTYCCRIFYSILQAKKKVFFLLSNCRLGKTTLLLSILQNWHEYVESAKISMFILCYRQAFSQFFISFFFRKTQFLILQSLATNLWSNVACLPKDVKVKVFCTFPKYLGSVEFYSSVPSGTCTVAFVDDAQTLLANNKECYESLANLISILSHHQAIYTFFSVQWVNYFYIFFGPDTISSLTLKSIYVFLQKIMSTMYY